MGSAGVVLQAMCSSDGIVMVPRTEQCGFNSYQRRKCLSIRRTVQNNPRAQTVGTDGCPLRLNWPEREATHYLLVPKVKKRQN